MGTFTELSLFSGAGGGILATKHLLGWKTICYVEWDKYAIEVLKARIRDGYLDDAPIWDDAFTFDGRPWAGLVDVVTAGFPCQPFSVAGKGLAENDPRNGWPATIRIIREVRPRFAWLENVPNLISKPYFSTILGEISEAGYSVEWDCVSAAEVGAPHKRERLWILATNSNGYPGTTEQERKHERPQEFIGSSTGEMGSSIPHTQSVVRNLSAIAGNPEEEIYTSGNGAPQPLVNTDSGRRGQFNPSRVTCDAGQSTWGFDEKRRGEWWAIEPDVGRVADGVASRVDRLRAIGNGQVPAVVREAWNRLGASK